MEWKLDFIQALEELAGHKLRTLLTLLGMVFGVGAVIAMLSIGEGAEREALKLIDAMGLRNVIVKGKPKSEQVLREVREDSMGLSLHDLEAIRETLPVLSGYAAIKTINTYAVFSHQATSDAVVKGVSPGYFSLGNHWPREGRPLLAHDDVMFSHVCVLGGRAARDLFGQTSALGRKVKVNHLWLTVVGVLEEKKLEKAEFEGVKLSGSGNDIYLPIRTALKKFRFKSLEDQLDEVHVQVKPGVDAPMAALTVSRLLDTRHRGVDDFELVVPQALLEQHRKTQRIFNIVMSCIAGISLLVGGIGIMNIMLANSLERTREIGIRRAVGARRSDIRRLFMIEAITIAVLGGLLGIFLGFAIAKAISVFSGWAVGWSMSAVLLSVGVCAGIGLVFGIFPAIKAARLHPIEALRHD